MHSLTRESTTAKSGAPVLQAERWRGPLELARRFWHRRAAVVGLAILLVLVGLAVATPWLTSEDPTRQQLAQVLLSPSLQHPLGTDYLGRDIFARLLYGAR